MALVHIDGVKKYVATFYNTTDGKLHRYLVDAEAGTKSDLGVIDAPMILDAESGELKVKVTGLAFDKDIEMGDVQLLDDEGSVISPATAGAQTDGSQKTQLVDADGDNLGTDDNPVVVAPAPTAVNVTRTYVSVGTPGTPVKLSETATAARYVQIIASRPSGQNADDVSVGGSNVRALTNRQCFLAPDASREFVPAGRTIDLSTWYLDGATSDAKATGTLRFGRDVPMGNVSIPDGAGSREVYFFPPRCSNGQIRFTDNPSDGDSFTLTDGLATKTFEFDDDDSVSEGAVAVEIGETFMDTATTAAAAVGVALANMTASAELGGYFNFSVITPNVLADVPPVIDSEALELLEEQPAGSTVLGFGSQTVSTATYQSVEAPSGMTFTLTDVDGNEAVYEYLTSTVPGSITWTTLAGLKIAVEANPAQNVWFDLDEFEQFFVVDGTCVCSAPTSWVVTTATQATPKTAAHELADALDNDLGMTIGEPALAAGLYTLLIEAAAVGSQYNGPIIVSCLGITAAGMTGGSTADAIYLEYHE